MESGGEKERGEKIDSSQRPQKKVYTAFGQPSGFVQTIKSLRWRFRNPWNTQTATECPLQLERIIWHHWQGRR